jgi:CRP-like cAMP-binding protein
MDTLSSPTTHPLMVRLETIASLSDDERQAIVALPITVRDVREDQDILRDQDRPSQCCLIIEGFAFRYKIMPSGKRQIYSFHIPGDIPDLQSLHLEVMDHSLGTLVPCKVGFIPHEMLRAFLRAHPRIGDIFWRDTLIDGAVFREWMANVGRREAYARVAHLLCELYVRLKAVGIANGQEYELPITQAELADATSMSTVHVNRSLQKLRAEGLIRSARRSVIIEDWEGLQAAGEFDPTYLHLKAPIPRAA